MSCGSPHATDCAEALLRVFEYLHGEMQPADLARIRLHLDECGPCLREFGIEEEVKVLLKRSHTGEHAPMELRGRVVSVFGSEHRASPGTVPPASFGPAPGSVGPSVSPSVGPGALGGPLPGAGGAGSIG